MSNMKQKDYPAKWIPLGDLSVVWLDAQRPRNEREEKRIAAHFDPDALDPLTVTLPNGDGTYHIIDGQTRHGALMRLWGDLNQRVPCRVLDARTKEEAARIWSTMNSGHKSPSAIERFTVGVTARDPEAVAINAIIEDMGFVIAADSTDGVISAVRALQTVFRKQGDVGLVWALGTIDETWGRDRDAYAGSIIQAYGDLLGKHQGVVDRKRIVKVVAKRYTPGRLVGAAKTARDMFKGTLPSNIVKILEATYNHRLRNSSILEA